MGVLKWDRASGSLFFPFLLSPLISLSRSVAIPLICHGHKSANACSALPGTYGLPLNPVSSLDSGAAPPPSFFTSITWAFLIYLNLACASLCDRCLSSFSLLSVPLSAFRLYLTSIPVLENLPSHLPAFPALPSSSEVPKRPPKVREGKQSINLL